MTANTHTQRASLSASERRVLAATLLYMAAWLIFALLAGNREFVFYFAVMCVLIVSVAAVHLRAHFRLAALWGLSLWGLAHMAGGLMPTPGWWPRLGESQVLYNAWLIPGVLKYDQLVHACGFGLVTWLCWQGLDRAFAARGLAVQPTFGLLTLCVAAATGFGAVNEIVEFIATLVIPGTNVGGYENTGWDLVANLVGSVLAALLIRFRSSSDRRPLRVTAE